MSDQLNSIHHLHKPPQPFDDLPIRSHLSQPAVTGQRTISPCCIRATPALTIMAHQNSMNQDNSLQSEPPLTQRDTSTMASFPYHGATFHGMMNQKSALPIHSLHAHEYANTMASFQHPEVPFDTSINQNSAPPMDSSYTHELMYNFEPSLLSRATDQSMVHGRSKTPRFALQDNLSYTQGYTNTARYAMACPSSYGRTLQHSINQNSALLTEPLYTYDQADSLGYAGADVPYHDVRTLHHPGAPFLDAGIPDHDLTTQYQRPTTIYHTPFPTSQTNSMHHIPHYEQTVPVAQTPARTIAASDPIGDANPHQVSRGIIDWKFGFQINEGVLGHLAIYISVRDHPVSVKRHQTHEMTRGRYPVELASFLNGYIGQSSDPKDKKFRCDMCKNQYHVRKIAYQHVARACSKRDFFCAGCGTKFHVMDEYIQHLERTDFCTRYVDQEINNKTEPSESGPKKGEGAKSDNERRQNPVLTNRSSGGRTSLVQTPLMPLPTAGGIRTQQSRDYVKSRRNRKSTVRSQQLGAYDTHTQT